MGEGLNQPLLALKLEEGGPEPRDAGGLWKLEDTRNRSFLRKEWSPATTLTLAQWEPSHTSNPQNCNINVGCLKPLHWWPFVTAAIQWSRSVTDFEGIARTRKGDKPCSAISLLKLHVHIWLGYKLKFNLKRDETDSSQPDLTIWWRKQTIQPRYCWRPNAGRKAGLSDVRGMKRDTGISEAKQKRLPLRESLIFAVREEFQMSGTPWVWQNQWERQRAALHITRSGASPKGFSTPAPMQGGHGQEKAQDEHITVQEHHLSSTRKHFKYFYTKISTDIHRVEHKPHEFLT